MDPLSNYGYSYPIYSHLPNLPNDECMYNVKIEHSNQNITNDSNSIIPQPCTQYPLQYQINVNPASVLENSITTDHQLTQLNNISTNENQQQNQIENNEEEIDTKEGIPLLPQHKKRVPKKKGKTSNYWNKKVEDKNFPFFGCTICNISFNTIQQLDEHVTIHKGRLTSYDIRLRNKLLRKERIKQMKKNKKLGKSGKKVKEIIKQETNFDIEIKPEDGYIGIEKASEFNNIQNPDAVNQNENNPNNNSNTTTTNDKCQEKNSTDDKCNNEDVTDDKKDDKSNVNKLKIPEPDDPRLLKLFKCFACQKQFSLSYYLRLHVRSHTDEKPYTCAECGQSFITASKLGRHNKRIHLAIRFQCRICYRFYSRFDILTRHFDKVHAADKIEGEPYDYNAILPYLKELEEQLRDQVEASAPKTEALWGDSSTQVKPDKDGQEAVDSKVILDNKNNVDPSDIKDTKEDLTPKFEEDTKDNVFDQNMISICTTHTEQAYVKCDADALPDSGGVKEELEDIPSPRSPQSPLSPPDARDDSNSDEDYFPSNTWAAPPVPPTPGPPPTPPRKGKGRGRGRGKHAFPMQCELCDKIINSNSYYKVHLRTHSGERPFKCYYCLRGFITSSKMHRHVLTHHELEGVENGEQKVKEELDPNIKEEEEKSGKTGKKKKKKGLKAVKLEGKKYRKRAHACVFCNKRFLHLHTLNVHKKSHEGETLILRCNFCLVEQPDETTLADHEATHAPPRPYLCTICGRTYTKKETMIYHRKSHTSSPSGAAEKKNFICDVCSKSFNAQCKLLRHLVSHNKEKIVLRYECPVCAHLFHTKYHINMHLTSHQKEGLILAENRNEILAMVLQNARKIPANDGPPAPTAPPAPPAAPPAPPAGSDDERSRVCNICGQVFQHFYYLEEHLKSHASAIAIEDEMKQEQNKHICPVCNKGFKLHYYLKLHSFTHSKERPFICQQCGKGFITKGKLKRHLETHTGLKKYQCHICCKFFTRPSYLRIHIRTIHGTQDYNFRAISKEYSIPPGAV